VEKMRGDEKNRSGNGMGIRRKIRRKVGKKERERKPKKGRFGKWGARLNSVTCSISKNQ